MRLEDLEKLLKKIVTNCLCQEINKLKLTNELLVLINFSLFDIC